MDKERLDQPLAPVIIHEEECEQEGWDDGVRGSIKWWTLLSADRTPSQSLTCGVAEIKYGSGEALRKHKHIQAEVYHILSGQGLVTIADQAYPVRVGSTVFIPGNAEHGIQNTGEEALRFFYVFAADSFAEIKYEFAEIVS